MKTLDIRKKSTTQKSMASVKKGGPISNSLKGVELGSTDCAEAFNH